MFPNVLILVVKALRVLWLAVCLAFMNLIARLILNTKCEIAVFQI